MSFGGKGRRSKPAKHKSLPDERRREIWGEVISRIVERRLVWYSTPTGESGRWRTEKPITGDKQIDEVEHKGARVIYDGAGRKRAEFDAGGKRIYFWRPKEQGE